MIAELVKGNSVTTADGTVVYPHQVIGPSRPGSVANQLLIN